MDSLQIKGDESGCADLFDRKHSENETERIDNFGFSGIPITGDSHGKALRGESIYSQAIERNAGGCRKVIITEVIARRFFSHVNKDGPTPAHHPELGPCHIWIGAGRPDHYGAFMFKRIMGAHRFAFLLANGFIDTSLQVQHRCDNPSCVNFSHLKQGTPKDNAQDFSRRLKLQRLLIQ